jgi:hypothetical protein
MWICIFFWGKTAKSKWGKLANNYQNMEEFVLDKSTVLLDVSSTAINMHWLSFYQYFIQELNMMKVFY